MNIIEEKAKSKGEQSLDRVERSETQQMDECY
jgi:hypothetical protein